MAIELSRQPTGEKAGNRKTSRPSDALLCDMDLPLRRTFYPLGYTVEIVTNHPDVLGAANDSFGHRRLRHGGANLEVHIGISEGGYPECPPEPTRREFHHLYSLVADAENQALLDLKTHTSFVWLNTSALRNKLYFRYNFLEKVVYLLLGSSVVTDIHGACVSKNGKGILLCGDSGAGKSTLAYACARAGWTYISDDTSYLINDSDIPRVIGHSHRMRFRPAAKALFPELAGRELTPRMEGKASIEVPVSEFPQMVTANEASVNAVVYLSRQASETGRLVKLPAGTATERTRKELYSAGEIRTKHEKILEVLSGVPAFALHYCEFDQAIQQLDRLAWGARINLNAPTL
jgi:energy-coupling factor transporter ATP-binding protein EcfA2